MSIAALNDSLFHYTFLDPLAAYEEPSIVKGLHNFKGFILVVNNQTPKISEQIKKLKSDKIEGNILKRVLNNIDFIKSTVQRVSYNTNKMHNDLPTFLAEAQCFLEDTKFDKSRKKILVITSDENKGIVERESNKKRLKNQDIIEVSAAEFADNQNHDIKSITVEQNGEPSGIIAHLAPAIAKLKGTLIIVDPHIFMIGTPKSPQGDRVRNYLETIEKIIIAIFDFVTERQDFVLEFLFKHDLGTYKTKFNPEVFQQKLKGQLKSINDRGSMRVNFVSLEKTPEEIDSKTQKLEEEVHDRYILNKNFCISTGRGICSYGFDVTTGRIEIVDLDLNLLAYERVKDKNEVYGEDSMSLLRHEICELREL